MSKAYLDMSPSGHQRINVSIPWGKLSKMANAFTRRAQKLEQIVSVDPNDLVRRIEAEGALIEYSVKFAEELKKYGLKLGSH